MTRKDWLLKLSEATKPRPKTLEESDALVEALLLIAATVYAAGRKVGSASMEELTDAAYDALQDKAEEIKTRN